MGLHPCRISSAVQSTTLPPLQGAKTHGRPQVVGGVLGEDDSADKPGEREFPAIFADARPSRRGQRARAIRVTRAIVKYPSRDAPLVAPPYKSPISLRLRQDRQPAGAAPSRSRTSSFVAPKP